MEGTKFLGTKHFSVYGTSRQRVINKPDTVFLLWRLEELSLLLFQANFVDKLGLSHLKVFFSKVIRIWANQANNIIKILDMR